MIIAAHASDNHGDFIAFPKDADVVFHSGDLMPNRSRGIRPIEETFQPTWLEDNKQRIQDWIGDRKLLLTPGNHDFVDPCPALRSFGVDAHNLHTEGPYQLADYTVIGFPYVNAFTREWNFEVERPDMQWKISTLLAPEFTADRKTILVAHSPIFGVLDRNFYGTRCGSMEMRQFLQECPHPPEFYLCGHIHESQGKCGPWNNAGTMIYNSARCVHRLHLDTH